MGKSKNLWGERDNIDPVVRKNLVTLGVLFLLGLVGVSVPNRFVESLGLDHRATAGPPAGTSQEQALLNWSE